MSSVKILNPVPRGSAFVGRSRAERYVNAGRASWAGPSAILFDSSHSAYQSAVTVARETYGGYDRRGSMKLSEMRNIPIINAEKMHR